MSSPRGVLLILLAALMLAAAGSSQAAVTGKIHGVVVDKKTNEPLPSVVVQIVGTSQGDYTNTDGEFLILNVPPGTYSVEFRLMGYRSYKVEEVQVITGRRSEVNAELEEESVKSDTTIIVRAQRDIMELDKPSSNVTFTSEDIAVMPVQDVDQILQASVGVVRRYGELHIRGGRSGEVSYVVDGVETKDPLGGLGPTDAGMNLSSNTIEEIQIIKGGFDPEYGRAMSGIVTINTKTGSQTTEGHAELYTDNFRAPNLNKNSNNFDRLYFSLGGPEPFLASQFLPALGIDYFQNKLFYFVSIDAYKTDTYYSMNEYTSPSRKRDWLLRDLLWFKIRDRQYNSFSITSKLNYKITNNINVVFNYQGTWTDENIFRWDYRYTPATAPIGNDVNERYSVTLTHQINKSTFYEVLVSNVQNKYVRKPDDPANPGVGLLPVDFRFSNQPSEYEDYVDKNGNGVYDAPEPFVNVYYDTSYSYGGPQYNYGDVYIRQGEDEPNHLYDPWNSPQSGYNYDTLYLDPAQYIIDEVDTILWDWNRDGYVSYEEGEPFVDLNNNGKWDRGDELRNDQNGNKRYDPELADVVAQRLQEPFTDGDLNQGEPFFDLNGNGEYEQGIDLFVKSVDPTQNQDLNRNNRYDGPDDPWTVGIPYVDMNGNGIYDAPNLRYDPGEPFVDLNGNGKWDEGGSDAFLVSGVHDGLSVSGDEDPHYQRTSSETWTFDFKLTKQIVREHEMKTGFQLLLRDFTFAEITNPWYRRTGTDALPDGGPWPDRGGVRDFYEHDPIEGAFFIQDIVEYGSLVARLGVRYDFFFQSDAVDTLVAHFAKYGRGAVVDSRGKISPRLGISYPITEKAKIYFNYGHFYQLPRYTRMYRRLGQSLGTIGNPNLDYEKTVQYEFGVRYNLSGDYVLDIAGFYKDIFGIINTQKIDPQSPRDWSDFQNSDYGRSRGFEIQLDKKYGNYVSGYVNYTYAFAFGKASSETANYEDLAQNREVPIREFPLDWDVRHAVNINFDLRISRADHPRLFGFSIPNAWGLNVLWQFSTGVPFTPADGFPNMRREEGEKILKNSMRLPSTSQVDVRFNKDFTLVGIDYSAQLWIENIFDTENVRDVYSQTGLAYTKTIDNGIVRGGTDYEQSPYNYLPGRNIRVGLTMTF